MTVSRYAGSGLNEVVFQAGKQLQPRIGLLTCDTFRKVEILHTQRVGIIAVLGNRGVLTTDNQRSMFRSQETRTKCRRAQKPIRRDADKIGQFRIRIAQTFAEKRTHRRISDRPLRQVACPHHVCRSSVVAFLGSHRSDYRQILHLLRNSRQVLTNLNARNRRIDRLELTAIFVIRLRIERINLARPTAHPKQNASPLALRILRRRASETWEPVGQRHPQCTTACQPQHVST